MLFIHNLFTLLYSFNLLFNLFNILTSPV